MIATKNNLIKKKKRKKTSANGAFKVQTVYLEERTLTEDAGASCSTTLLSSSLVSFGQLGFSFPQLHFLLHFLQSHNTTTQFLHKLKKKHTISLTTELARALTFLSRVRYEVLFPLFFLVLFAVFYFIFPFSSIFYFFLF